MTHGFDQCYVLEHDLEELPILLIVSLSVVCVDIDLAPFWVSYALEHYVKYLEDKLSNACRQLVHLVVALDPRGEEIDHRPAHLQAVRVKDRDCLLQDVVRDLSEILARIGVRERVELGLLSCWLLQRKAPLAHMADRSGDGLHVGFLLVVVVCVPLILVVSKELIISLTDKLFNVPRLFDHRQFIKLFWHSFSNDGSKALKCTSSQMLDSEILPNLDHALLKVLYLIPVDERAKDF